MTKRKPMMIIAILTLAGIAYAATTTSIIKVSRLSDTEASVSCKNGADPTGRKIGKTLILSCGN